MKAAKTGDEANACMLSEVSDRISPCTDKLLETYWAAFPKSKVFQCDYDIPCMTGSCSSTRGARDPFCGANITCHNEHHVLWQHAGVDARQAKYPQPKYTGLNILGTGQKAAGVAGADVGKPVLSKDGPCQWMAGCVHPIPGKPAANAIGEVFWDLFFSKYVENVTMIV
jgi:hypothetical protein